MELGQGPFRIGVDIGGTFSDFVILDESSGRLDVLKVPSTPADPSVAVHDGLGQLTQAGMPRGSVQFFSHGTTIATNALLEGKGAVTGLLITGGFRAVQEVQDQTRGSGPSIYNFFFERPTMLVPQERTAEIIERVDYRGDVLTPIDLAAARLDVQRLLDLGVESFAISLLFSFMNPAHERALRDVILELEPNARVSLSSDVLPMIREWFRLSTTQVNAYVAPRLYRYLRQMEQRLEDGGIVTRQRYVMQSNGGVTSFGSAADRAVTTILSGPAAGVIAGARLAEVSGFDNVITFDIGGTSTDIALVDGGIPVETTSGRVAGYDVAAPVLDINTISAGGGTVAWVDEVGSLHCGPHSAGADPGPACYGKGGTEATTTDANLLLGYLSPTYFLGGRLALDPARAEAAVRAKVAEPLGLSVEDAAAGIIRLINVEMAQGIRTVSSERGYDLRDFALVAFGGAGPLHAGELASELGLPCVIVPRYPGLTSAQGLLMCDVKHDYARSRLEPLYRVDPADAQQVFNELDKQATTDLTAEGFAADTVVLLHQLDLRYAGQGYELRVDVIRGPITRDALNEARAAFDDLHERLHGHRAEGAPVEVVTYWTIALARVPTVSLEPTPLTVAEILDAADARKGVRRAWFRDLGWVECSLYERDRLHAGVRLNGPVIIEQVDSTTVVHPGQSIEVDEYDNMLLWVRGQPTAAGD
jgi:N-methylhydantoinase A